MRAALSAAAVAGAALVFSAGKVGSPRRNPRWGREPRWRLVVVVPLFALALSACKVDVSLGVGVDDDGSGRVQVRFVLDAEAIEAIGGELGENLRVADLLQAGWQVQVDEDDDGAEVVATREFGTPEQLTEVVDELSGDVGPFRDFRLTRDRSFARTRFAFEGTVDLEGGVGGTTLDPSDLAVAEELEGEDVGVDDVQRFLSEQLDEVFGFEVVVALPGDGAHNAPSEVGGEPRWSPKVGETVQLRADATSTDLARITWLALAGLLLALAVGVYTGRIWVRRRRGEARVGAESDPGSRE